MRPKFPVVFRVSAQYLRLFPYCLAPPQKTRGCFAVVFGSRLEIPTVNRRQKSRQPRRLPTATTDCRLREIPTGATDRRQSRRSKIRGWFLRGGGARRLPRGVPLAVVSFSRCGGDVLRSRRVRAATPCRVCRPRSAAPCGACFFASAGVGASRGVIGQPSRLRALWWRFWRCWRHCRAWRCYPLPLSR